MVEVAKAKISNHMDADDLPIENSTIIGIIQLHLLNSLATHHH